MRRDSKQRRVRDSATRRGISSGYLEGNSDDEDEEGGVSLAAIKNRFKKGAKKGEKFWILPQSRILFFYLNGNTFQSDIININKHLLTFFLFNTFHLY